MLCMLEETKSGRTFATTNKDVLLPQMDLLEQAANLVYISPHRALEQLMASAAWPTLGLTAISGNVPTNEMKGFSGIRQNGFQEMNIVSMTKTITKYSVTANSPDNFADIIERAYNMALLGRKGGVCIDFPLDIQQADIIGR